MFHDSWHPDLGLSAPRNVRSWFLLGVSPTAYGVQLEQTDTLEEKVQVPLSVNILHTTLP